MPLTFPSAPHTWSLTPRAAIAVQHRLAGQVRQEPLAAPVRYVAGVDAAFANAGTQCVAAAVLWDMLDGRVVEVRVRRRPVRFPYVPGLLSFREAPALLSALRSLSRMPDLLLCDGHGLAHPRRFGIACHLGVWCDLPAIGCAKSLLVGRADQPGRSPGSRCPLRLDDELLGAVVRTREGSRPVYVSVGHRIDLESAVRVVLACAMGHRLPEPTHAADRCVARERQRRVLRADAEGTSSGPVRHAAPTAIAQARGHSVR